MKKKTLVIIGASIVAVAVIVGSMITINLMKKPVEEVKEPTYTQAETIQQQAKEYVGTVESLTEAELDEALSTELTEEQVEDLNKAEEETFVPEMEEIIEVDEETGTISYKDTEGNIGVQEQTDYQKAVSELTDEEFDQYIQESLDGEKDPLGLIEQVEQQKQEVREPEPVEQPEEQVEIPETPNVPSSDLEALQSLGLPGLLTMDQQVTITEHYGSTRDYDDFNPNWNIGS